MASPNSSLYQLSADSSFHFEILRPMSLGVYDGADMSEVLTAANSIAPGDFDSWTASFISLANNVYKRAQQIVKNKFPVSARTAFFSAATHFRSADFFLHGNASDPRIYDFWASQTAAFDQGLALLDFPAHRLTIKTSDFDIPAIWYAPNNKTEKRPTLVVGNGYDGSQEEMYHVIGLAAIERGYNVLSYEGPGQPSVRRYQHLGFIPDWERVVTPVVDHLLTDPCVDPDALALLGLSFGGYLAPRAAAFDHRFAAVLAIDGVWDFYQEARKDLGPQVMALFDAGNKTGFDEQVLKFLDPPYPTGLRWGLGQGMWAFAETSPFDFVTKTKGFTLEGVIDKVKTPVFVGNAQSDIFFAGQPGELAQALGTWGHFFNFTDADYIGTHAGLGSLKQQNAVLFEWLEGILGAKA